MMLESQTKSKRAHTLLEPSNGDTPQQQPALENTEAVPISTAPDIAAGEATKEETPREPTAGEIYARFYSLVTVDNPLNRLAELRTLVTQLLKTVAKPFEVSKKYNWLIIHDPLPMTRADADRIYKVISKFKDKREIGLVITSGGGQIEPAYLISKLCRESTSGKFIAVVPRRAKSGATLVCCGADEIHMGQMSELGPIDPQLDDLPALGLKNAVQHLAELVTQFPKASDMFAKYLTESLDLENLGYYERLAESAVQYAERLFRNRKLALKGKPEDVAKHLVYGYKDHAFVIDQMEAETIFGDSMIRRATQEYKLGNALYEWLAVIGRACDGVGYSFYLYGSPDSECECQFMKKRK